MSFVASADGRIITSITDESILLAGTPKKLNPVFTTTTNIVKSSTWPTQGFVVSTSTNASLGVALFNPAVVEGANARWLSSAFTAATGLPTGALPYVQIQYPTPVTVISYIMAYQWQSQKPGWPATWQIEGSVDNATYVLVQTGAMSGSENGVKTYTVTSPQTYQYWRFVMTKVPALVGYTSWGMNYLNFVTQTDPTAFTLNEAGALGNIASYETTVSAFALVRLFWQYSGPVVQLRRSLDGATIDVWCDNTGEVYQYRYTTTSVVTLATSLSVWMTGSTSIFVTLWYDQSSRAKHLIPVSAAPLYEYDATLASYAVRFTGTQQLQATGNAFATPTVTNMQTIARVRETTRRRSFGISYNGNNDSARFILTIPYSDGTWYFNVGTTSGAVASAASLVPVGTAVNLAAYKSPAQNGLRVNTFAYTAVNAAVGGVTGGLRLGWGDGQNHIGFFKYVLTFDSRLPDATVDRVFTSLI